MGSRDSTGISYQSFSGSTSSSPSSTNCSQPRAECSNRFRGQTYDRKSSYPCSQSQRKRAGFCQRSFPCPKKGRWATPSSKFASSKSVHSLRTFQNGGDTHAPGSSTERRLFGEGRPKGCLLYGTRLEKSSKIPSVCLEGNNVRVCMPPIRFIQCPTGVHKVDETCGCPIAKTGHSFDYLSGRHTHYGRDRIPGQTPCTNHVQPSGDSRICDKLSEIPPCAIKRDGIFRVFDKLPNYDSCPSSGKNPKSYERVSTPPRVAGGYSARIGQGSRSPYVYHSSCLSSPPTLSSLTGKQKQSSRFASHIRALFPTNHTGQRGTGVVEGQLTSLEWKGPSYRESRLNYRDRCLQKRLGGILYGNVHRRGVVPSRIFSAHKLPGTFSRSLCNKNFYQGKSPNDCSPAYGQYVCSTLHKQDGRYQIPCSGSFSTRSLGLVSRTQNSGGSKVSTRHIEYSSRQGVQSNAGPPRLETRPPSVLHNKSAVGPTGSGSFCFPADNTTPKVLQLETRSTGRGVGCFFPRLEQSEGICLPSLCPSGQMPQTTSRPECVTSGAGSTSLAVPAVVSTPSTELHSNTSSVTPLSRTINPPDRDAPIRQSPTSRLAAISQSYVKAGISQPAQELLLAAWRKGTTTTYASAWKKWDSWCCGRQINSVHAPVEAILEFLTSEFNSGKAYRTLNVYRSAISSTHAHIDFVRVGEHPLVIQLLKGAYNMRPPLPRYSSMWDVGVVLSFLESLGVNDHLTLKDLSQKLGLLLALTAMERVSEVIAHDLRYRRYSRDGVTFHLPELTKKSKVGSTLKSSFHASFPSNPKLCVVECLKEYEKRTLGFRPTNPSMPNRLLLSHIKPHKPISSATLGRWLKEIISRAGIDTGIFKAHSVRGAAATSSFNMGIPLQDILNLADWSTDSTFRRFYYKPTNQPLVARSLISGSHESR